MTVLLASKHNPVEKSLRSLTREAVDYFNIKGYEQNGARYHMWSD